MVGRKVAEEIYNKDIALEEYLTEVKGIFTNNYIYPPALIT